MFRAGRMLRSDVRQRAPVTLVRLSANGMDFMTRVAQVRLSMVETQLTISSTNANRYASVAAYLLAKRLEDNYRHQCSVSSAYWGGAALSAVIQLQISVHSKGNIH